MAAQDFAIVEARWDEVPVLVVSGALGLHEAWTLESHLLSLLDEADQMVVDLSAVDEVAGGLVGALLRTRRRMSGTNAAMVVVVSGPPVSTIISTSVLHALIDIAPTVPVALEMLGPTAGLVADKPYP